MGAFTTRVSLFLCRATTQLEKLSSLMSVMSFFDSDPRGKEARALLSNRRQLTLFRATALDLNPGLGAQWTPLPARCLHDDARCPRYLQRLQLDAPPPRTLAGLTLLQQRHNALLPFETLSCLLRDAVPIDLDSVQRKLLDERRGGYCFELNGGLLALLQALGFDAQPLSARVLLAPERRTDRAYPPAAARERRQRRLAGGCRFRQPDPDRAAAPA